jgi:cell wall-associated NlpC family hydrolase
MANSGYNTALEHASSLTDRGLLHAGDLAAPFGALVFYNTAGGGHVAFSLGQRQIITTPAKSGQSVYQTTIDHFPAYLGWSWADPEWPGRGRVA